MEYIAVTAGFMGQIRARQFTTGSSKIIPRARIGIYVICLVRSAYILCPRSPGCVIRRVVVIISLCHYYGPVDMSAAAADVQLTEPEERRTRTEPVKSQLLNPAR